MTTLTLPSLRIMIVDPRPNSISLLRSILTALGPHQIIASDNTETALLSLREEHFDVVFCDEGVTPLNPVAFTKAVRRDSGSKNLGVHILVLTSAARKRQVELARDCGANHILVRPMSLATVRGKLESLLANPPSFVKSPSFFGPDRRRKGRRGAKNGLFVDETDKRVRTGRRESDMVKDTVENPVEPPIAAPVEARRVSSKDDFFI